MATYEPICTVSTHVQLAADELQNLPTLLDIAPTKLVRNTLLARASDRGRRTPHHLGEMQTFMRCVLSVCVVPTCGVRIAFIAPAPHAAIDGLVTEVDVLAVRRGGV